ncbi:MAG: elongation factor P [Anaerolineales bacterium]
MIDANELRKGVTFEQDNNLYKVIDYSHHKPGRGKATIRVKARNLRTGANIEMTFSSSDRVQDAQLDHHKVQYLYTDGEHYYFMDVETYEQPAILAGMIGDAARYLLGGMEVKLTFYEQEPLDIEIPLTVEHKIKQVDQAVRGDTATGISTRAITETGLVVQVPAFIKVGDTIRIDTRTGNYVTRVKS